MTRNVIIKKAELETVCGVTSSLPKNEHYEVAFAGKSNVGKSSMINTLLNRKALARTSSQPGKTQTINFYHINDEFYLVDLPGYGYATASVEIKAQWGRMIERYLQTSVVLKAVFLLVDIRHEPSENDRMMYSWMVSQGFHPIVIATKADKLSRSQIPVHITMVKNGLMAEPDTRIIPFSAETRQGFEEIWNTIADLIPMEKSIKQQQEATKQDPTKQDSTKQEPPQSGTQKKPRWKAVGKQTGKRKQQEQKRRKQKEG